MHLRAIPDTVARPAAGLARAIARGGKGVLALAVATVLLVVAVQPILAQPVYTGATSDASAGGTGLLDGLAFTGPTGAAGMDADHQERMVIAGLLSEQGIEPGRSYGHAQ
ncbi:MAG: hypothetical protein ACOZDY_04225 [Pseudomonadota bacterium]